MPLYEYQCRSCNARFEQLVFNREQGIVCRECGSGDVSRLLSTFAVASPGAKTPDPGPCGSCGAAQRGMCGFNQN